MTNINVLLLAEISKHVQQLSFNKERKSILIKFDYNSGLPSKRITIKRWRLSTKQKVEAIERKFESLIKSVSYEYNGDLIFVEFKLI